MLQCLSNTFTTRFLHRFVNGMTCCVFLSYALVASASPIVVSTLSSPSSLSFPSTLFLPSTAVVSSTSAASSAENALVIQTNKEKEPLKIAYRVDSSPLQYKDDSGYAKGILIDYWLTWSHISGIPIEFVGGSNSETQAWLKEGKVDLIAGLFKSAKREKSMAFSKSLLHSEYSLFYNPQIADVKQRDDINIYSVGVTRDSFHHQWLKNNYPNADIRPYRGYKNLFEAANRGEIQLFITQPLYFSQYRQNNAINVRFQSLDSALYVRPYQAAVRKQEGSKLTLINRYIEEITNQKKDEISAKWSGFQWEYLPQKPKKSPHKNKFLSQLTKEEKNWLKEHPVIPIGVDGNWPPVDFTNSDGQHSGIISEYLKILESRLEVQFSPQVHDSFKQMVNKVRLGEIPVGTTIVKTKDRTEDLWFTAPYFSAVKVIASNAEGVQYSDLEQLKEKTLAIEDGFYLADSIKQRYPDIHLKTYPSTADAVKALSFREVDAYIGNQAVISWLMQQLQITNVSISGDPRFDYALQRFAIQKNPEWKPLVAILNKALASISPTQRQGIINLWLNNQEQLRNADPLVLTDQEQQWLNQHTQWILGIDSNWPPFEFVDTNGEYKGISADIMALLQADIGVETKAQTDLNWQQTLSAFKEKQLDILTLVSPTPESMTNSYFTKPYSVSPYMIFVHEETRFVANIRDLKANKVGIVKDHAIEYKLSRDYPELDLVKFDSNRDALMSLSSGDIDAYVGVLGSATWTLKDLGLRNVKIAAPTEYKFEQSLAVRKDWPELIPILNKAIDRISQQQITQIENRWFAVEFEHQVSTYQIWKAIFITCLIVLPITCVIWIWNRKLTKAKDHLRESRAHLAEAKKAAEQANKFKSQFLANMSHEIRTPMNAIVGMTHLMQTTELTERQHDYTNKIKRASLTLLGVINNILDFSKIEAGKLEIEAAKFELNDIVVNLSNLFALKAAEKEIDILFDIDSDLPESFIGDALRLEQVLINLIQNALKFTEAGQVIVQLRQLEKNDETTTVQFSVIDSGIGISPESLKKLFQPFTQVDASNTRTHGGTGLGLSISRQLIELMGGCIKAESELGKGSNFNFTLSMRVAATQQSAMSYIMDPELKGLRVLLVDDNKIARHINAEILRSFSFHVDTANGGLEAINTLQQTNKQENEDEPSEAYHLVIVDWKMPEMDGIETSRYIKRANLAVMPAVILITAYGREDVMQQAETENLDAFLIKPLNASLLFDSIMRVFHQTKKQTELVKQEANQSLKGHVLLVEDHAINQEVAQEMLGLIGISCKIAQNGQQALELLSAESFDLVLMDIQMPVMDGFETTEAIRQQACFADLPIIAMTAHAMKEDQKRCFDMGMNDHIAKPIDSERLYFVLSQWLEKQPLTDKSDEINANGSDIAANDITENFITNSHIKNSQRNNRKTNEIEFNKSDSLTSIAGLDVQWGVKRVGGNEALYEKLVGDFYDRHHNELASIEKARKNKQDDDIKRMVHTIRGVSGNIGAKPLEQLAADFELALKNEPSPFNSEAWQQFESGFNSLFTALSLSFDRQEVLPVNDTAEAQPIKGEELANKLKPLTALLESGNPKAKAELKALEGEIPHELYQHLSDEINEFEFDNALKVLEANM